MACWPTSRSGASRRRDAGRGWDSTLTVWPDSRGAAVGRARRQPQLDDGPRGGCASAPHSAGRRRRTTSGQRFAYELAAPLVPASSFVSLPAMILELAELDRRNGFGVRPGALARSAIAAFPPLVDKPEPEEWGERVDAMLDIVWGQIDATGTVAGMSVETWSGPADNSGPFNAAGVPPAATEGPASTIVSAEGGAWTKVPPQRLAEVAGFATSREGVALGEGVGVVLPWGASSRDRYCLPPTAGTKTPWQRWPHTRPRTEVGKR